MLISKTDRLPATTMDAPPPQFSTTTSTFYNFRPVLESDLRSGSRIDYCNSLLIGLPKTRLSPLQTVLNTAARLIARLPRYSHISYYLKEHLHWLPISTCIDYKVLLIVLKAQMGVAPKYLRDVIRLPTSATSLRPLRSMERRELFVPRARTTMAMSR